MKVFILCITLANSGFFKMEVQSIVQPFKNEYDCLKTAQRFELKYQNKYDFLYVECKEKEVSNKDGTIEIK